MEARGLRRGFGLALAASVFVLLAVTSVPAEAQYLRLRTLQTDAQGKFTVMFSLFESGLDREPITDVAEVPTSALSLYGGDVQAEMSDLAMDELQSLTTLVELGVPFRVVVMIPDTSLFNGPCETDENGRVISCDSDVQELRSALSEGLHRLPPRENITIEIGFYNERVRWIEYKASQLAELGASLLGQDYQDHDTVTEDPFNAIDTAYRQKLRRQAAEATSTDDFAYFFIVVTSGIIDVGQAEAIAAQVDRYRDILSDRQEMSHVVTIPIVYDPLGFQDIWAEGSQALRLMALTPPSGVFRMANDRTQLRQVFNRTFDEIANGFILRFNNGDLESNKNHFFRLEFSASEGAEVESNVIQANVTQREVNIWKWVIIGGSILIGLILLIIIIVFIAKRPKKEAAVEAPVAVEKAPDQCVQCGRLLREGLQYCPHCAQEPNYGLIRVVEGPHAGWTFFIRQTVTKIGRGGQLYANSIVLAEDLAVSTEHIAINVQEGHRYMIEDLKSANKTFIDGQEVSKQFLKDGQIIQLGPTTRIKFSISG